MDTHGRRLAVAMTLALVVALVSPAHAGAPTEALKQHVDEAVTTLSDPALRDKPDARRERVRKVAEEIFDYRDTARRALGPHWNARTPEQQQEFVRLFSEVLDRAYGSKIELYQGERVQYVGETIDGDEATVKTTIVTKKSTDFPVDYRMHLRDGRWLVYDVVIESVSLVANYRTQFNRIVQTEGYDSLVQRLRAKDGAQPAASPGRPRSAR